MEAIGKDVSISDSAVNGTDDREALPKFWIAAYTRPKSEKKASLEISKMGIDTYLPVQTVERQWSDRKKKIDMVVIPNVVFASVQQKHIDLIRKHHLIIKILTLPGRKEPAHIPSIQIENLKLLLDKSESPVDFSSVELKKKLNVRVVRGSLQGVAGTIERLSENKTKLKVCIDFLGGAMIEVNSSDIEVLG